VRIVKIHIDFETSFTVVFGNYARKLRKTLPLAVFDPRNITDMFYDLKVKNPIYAIVSCFRPPNKGKGSSWMANFDVVGKSRPNFPITSH